LAELGYPTEKFERHGDSQRSERYLCGSPRFNKRYGILPNHLRKEKLLLEKKGSIVLQNLQNLWVK
jgi:hypothetical protein